MITVQEAKELCVLAHKGQYRRDSTPYHTHPFAVADMLSTDEEKIVGYLHDVLEDCEGYSINLEDFPYTLKTPIVAIEVPHRVLEALLLLTHNKNDSYEEYISAILNTKTVGMDSRSNHLATKVKIADITHNLADNPNPRQIAKYTEAMKILLRGI